MEGHLGHKSGLTLGIPGSISVHLQRYHLATVAAGISDVRNACGLTGRVQEIRELEKIPIAIKIDTN